MKKRTLSADTNRISKAWKKPEIYKLQVNETLGGNKGNGEVGHPTHKPKASV